MKLSAHYSRSSILITLAILLVSGFLYFFSIKAITKNLLDNDLDEEMEEVADYIKQNQKLPINADKGIDQIITPTSLTHYKRRFFDTVYTNPNEKAPDVGRSITDIITLKGNHYKVVLTTSTETTEDLTKMVTVITLLLMIVLLCVVFVTNKYILNRLWMPFHATLYEMKKFNIADTPEFFLQNNNVDEFNELNQAVQEMSARITNDFKMLKSFTENVSHELMTPLAVITSKLDTLIQDETLNANQLSQITDIYSSLNKSTRLNQSLMLLVKLDNNLINDDEEINFKDILTEKILQFQESIHARNIRIHTDLTDKRIKMSRYLADILLNNLLSNGIRHTNDNGELNMTLNNKRFVIENTAKGLPLSKSVIFERFQKGNESHGTGLGLTLVKSICQYYKLGIDYDYQNNKHIFTIDFVS